MTIVIEKYVDKESGLCADIEIEKYSTLFNLDVYKPYEDGSPFAYPVFNGSYMTKASARRAMKRYGNFKREEI